MKMLIEKGIEVVVGSQFDDLETDPIAIEFARLFVAKEKYNGEEKGRIVRLVERWHTEVVQKEAHPRFAGSGTWLYEFKGQVFKVEGTANGRGFHGTTYYIGRVSV